MECCSGQNRICTKRVTRCIERNDGRMNKKEIKMAKEVIEYIQQLAGRDKLTVTFYLNDFMSFISAPQKDSYEYLDIIVGCMEWITGFYTTTNKVLSNNVSIHNWVEYIEIDDGNRLTVKFNKITKEVRKEDKNWLMKRLNEGLQNER
nr:MAG TPA: hypothetical protein [Caudoviricetes sp.]